MTMVLSNAVVSEIYQEALNPPGFCFRPVHSRIAKAIETATVNIHIFFLNNKNSLEKLNIAGIGQKTKILLEFLLEGDVEDFHEKLHKFEMEEIRERFENDNCSIKNECCEIGDNPFLEGSDYLEDND